MINTASRGLCNNSTRHSALSDFTLLHWSVKMWVFIEVKKSSHQVVPPQWDWIARTAGCLWFCDTGTWIEESTECIIFTLFWELQISCQHVVGSKRKHRQSLKKSVSVHANITLVMHFHSDVAKAIRPIIPSPQPVDFSLCAQINWFDCGEKWLPDLAVI